MSPTGDRRAPVLILNPPFVLVDEPRPSAERPVGPVEAVVDVATKRQGGTWRDQRNDQVDVGRPQSLDRATERQGARIDQLSGDIYACREHGAQVGLPLAGKRGDMVTVEGLQ